MRIEPPLFGTRPLIDRGAAGLHHAILRCQTRRSVLYVTAHPDDEDAAALAYLSRGLGVRTALLSLTRGESGDNAVGPENGEMLGLRRTEELVRAAEWMGLDEVFFGPFFDYGYSKRVSEAFDRWGRERIVATVIEAIRRTRPFVVLSRFAGVAADGHAHHQAAGLAVSAAFERAADPEVEGLSAQPPHQARRLFVWTDTPSSDPGAVVALPVGTRLPVVGMSPAEIGAEAMAEHRTQTAGKRTEPTCDAVRRYRWVAGEPLASDVDDLFAGIEAELPDGTLDASASEDIAERLARAMTAVARPDQAIAPLSEALELVRPAIRTECSREMDDLAVDLQRALVRAADLELIATATPEGDAPPSRFFDPFPTLAAAVPGVPFTVDVCTRGPSVAPDTSAPTALRVPDGWSVERQAATRFRVTPGGHVAPPYRVRRGDGGSFDRYASHADPLHVLDAPPVSAVATFAIDGQRLEVERPVEARRPAAPHERGALWLLPPAELDATPTVVVARPSAPVTITVTLTPPQPATIEAWTDPLGTGGDRAGEPLATQSHEGARSTMVLPPLADGRHVVRVRAQLGNQPADQLERESREHTVDAALVATSRLTYFRPAEVTVVSAAIDAATDRLVAYVPGPGDGIPAAARALGFTVRELDTPLDAVAFDGTAFDVAPVLVVGLHAYAVRPDLSRARAELLAAAASGAHVIVLGQTSGYDPARYAPYPATLPPAPEEVCEEDAPVTMVAPRAGSSPHVLLRSPNRIDESDFDGWVEQRGSKLWSDWDARYEPLLEAHDHGQPPQRGLLLSAAVGRGRYTYCALALDRQLRHGVPGAYRILANLLSA